MNHVNTRKTDVITTAASYFYIANTIVHKNKHNAEQSQEKHELK